MKLMEKHPLVMIIIGIASISLSAIFVKYSQAPSVVTALYRLMWTVALMTPVVLGRKDCRRELRETDRKTVLLCGASGVFLALHFTAWFESLNQTSVASSTAIVCTEVIWVALGYCLFMKGKISVPAGVSILVTVGGSLLIAFSDYSAGGNHLYGDVLALAAAVFCAVYTLIGRQARGYMSTTIYTYIVYVFCALALALVPPLLVGDWVGWVQKALIFLVVSCPCALVISVPLSFFGGIGGASRQGILVKGGNYLEVLANTEIVVFDKTGTLTKGVFNVTAIHPEEYSESGLLEMAALAESYSDHPISRSLKEAWGQELDASRVGEVEELSGRGVRAQVDGKTVEQTYCTPFLGYPFYSRHDTTVHNNYHNDDCPPMRGFYRWHIPDPIHFEEDIRVTLQQIGVCHRGLFERQDDVATVAYWYQDKPYTDFPPLPEKEERWPR